MKTAIKTRKIKATHIIAQHHAVSMSTNVAKLWRTGEATLENMEQSYVYTAANGWVTIASVFRGNSTLDIWREMFGSFHSQSVVSVRKHSDRTAEILGSIAA